MKNYLFVLVNSAGRFYRLETKELEVKPEIGEVFEIGNHKWKIKNYEGSIGEYGKLIYGVYVLENIS